MRRALLHAIDRNAISERLFEGKQPVADTFVHPLDSVHTDDVRKYPFEPDTARQLLDGSGWTDIRKGIRHNAAGEPLRIEIMTTAGNRVRELVEQVIQSNLREVGVDLRIRNQPARVLFGQTIRQREFPGMAMFAWFSTPENIPRTTLHSSMIPTAENGWSGQNYTGFANPVMDEAIDRVEVECGAAAQTRHWTTIQQTYAEVEVYLDPAKLDKSGDRNLEKIAKVSRMSCVVMPCPPRVDALAEVPTYSSHRCTAQTRRC